MKLNSDGKFVLVCLITFFIVILWIAFGRAETKDSPSMNLFTHSNLANTEADTTLHWWDLWKDHATGSSSAGELYFNFCTDSTFIYTYYNTGECYSYGIRQDLPDSLLAHAGENAFLHWGTMMKQFPSNTQYLSGETYYPTYSLRPGWNGTYDANSDDVRDSISDWDYNWNQTNFTISSATLTDAGGGKSGITWGTNTWQNAIVLIGSTDANAETITVNSSTANTLVLSRAPAGTPNFYIVDKSRTWNHRQQAYRKQDARVFIYDGCDRGEPYLSGTCDTSTNTVIINMADTNVQRYLAHDLARIMRSWRATPFSGKVGVFLDNIFVDIRCGDKSGCQGDFGDGANSLYESEMRSNIGYATQQRTCCQLINDSLHLNVTGKVATVGNVGEYKTDQYPDYMTASRPLNATFYELVGDITTSLSAWGEWKNTFDDAHDSGQQVFLMLKNSYWDTDSDSLKHERFLRGAGIYYTLLGHKNQNDTLANFLFICYTSSGGGATAESLEWWMPDAKFDMGEIAGVCSTYTSGRSCYYRRYTNGIALFYPAQGGTLNVPLGRYYHLVKSDGTLATDSVNSYTVNSVVYNGSYTGEMGRLFGISSSPPADTTAPKRCIWTK